MIVPALAIAACGSSTPANVAGSYTIAVTNRDNGCKLQNWTVGDMASNIGVTVTQDGSTATATVNGVTGGYLTLALGSNVFTGNVDGDFLRLTLFGTRSQSSGNCTWTYNAVLGGTLTGDILQGSIDYEAKTNGNPDCTTMGITGCASSQDFNGTRPPT
jgi:hypothetical protein